MVDLFEMFLDFVVNLKHIMIANMLKMKVIDWFSFESKPYNVKTEF